MATTIRVLMAQRGKRPGEVWPAAGISRSRWYRLMAHPETTTVEELEGIAGALGVPAAALLAADAAA